MDYITLKGVRVNNLKNIEARVPLSQLTVVTGVSGSGKSSLAFDTLYAEGQRRYVESMSAYARQFLERLDKPDADEITGICPAIAIRQKNSSRNPRSTVGTVTEIFDFLRLLYSRIGETICHGCGRPVRQDHPEQIAELLLQLPEGTRVYVLFPLLDLIGRPSEQSDRRQPMPEVSSSRRTRSKPARPVLDPALIESLRRAGFARLFLDREVLDLSVESPPKPRVIDESSYVLIDRLALKSDVRKRLVDSLETCFREGGGRAALFLLPSDNPDIASRVQQIWPHHKPGRPPGDLLKFSEQFECQDCGITYERPEPRLFSFNNPYGACPVCQGFGNTMDLDMNLVVPNPSLTLDEGAIEPWTKPSYRVQFQKLREFSHAHGIPLDVPFEELPEESRRQILEGAPGFPGVRGFFEHLETKKYKMHVRIFISRYRGYTLCHSCGGQRLRQEARDVFIAGRRITDVACMTIRQATQFFSNLELDRERQDIAEKILFEINHRLDLLMRVGLDYLGLDRLSSTLSGGEAQRIQLSTALGSSLVGALYVLDEPSIGLHPRDSDRLIQILKNLRDIGNTVLVVEHDPQIMRSADYLLDLGPGAGEKGGQVVFQGPLEELDAGSAGLTARYLSGDLRIPSPPYHRKGSGRFLEIDGIVEHNLKNLKVRLPLGTLTCLTGVSGSGKSTLAHEVVYAGLKRMRGEWKEAVGAFRSMRGAEHIADAILVDQSPIGKTPRSNPVTYMKAFDDIRVLFSQTREATSRNLGPGQFSFNVPGGRCERCQGSGVETVSMQFLADVDLMCEECGGRRYKPAILEIAIKGKNIHEVLQLTVAEALAFFAGVPRLTRKLKILEEVGLGYLRLGQSATTLSGGEAQRIKLCSFLAEQQAPNALYILDEPTTGLHVDDVGKLLRALDRLLNAGSTLLIVEHNLDIIKNADWIIDLGPEGGEAGGYIVAEGPPEEICRSSFSHTGRFLRSHLASNNKRK